MSSSSTSRLRGHSVAPDFSSKKMGAAARIVTTLSHTYQSCAPSALPCTSLLHRACEALMGGRSYICGLMVFAKVADDVDQ